MKSIYWLLFAISVHFASIFFPLEKQQTIENSALFIAIWALYQRMDEKDVKS